MLQHLIGHLFQRALRQLSPTSIPIRTLFVVTSMSTVASIQATTMVSPTSTTVEEIVSTISPKETTSKVSPPTMRTCHG
jgi:ABC-type transporter MlaC component